MAHLISPPACQSGRRPASLNHEWRVRGRRGDVAQGGLLHTKMRNKANMTAWWHLLLYIVSFYQSSEFHLSQTVLLQRRVSGPLAQLGWKWSWLWGKKWTDETLPSTACRQPRCSKSKWKGGLITVRFRQQMEKQMWLDIPEWPLLLLLPLLLLSIMVMIMPGVFVSVLPFVVFLLFLP